MEPQTEPKKDLLKYKEVVIYFADGKTEPFYEVTNFAVVSDIIRFTFCAGKERIVSNAVLFRDKVAGYFTID